MMKKKPNPQKVKAVLILKKAQDQKKQPMKPKARQKGRMM
jgi:hypothetical protein